MKVRAIFLGTMTWGGQGVQWTSAVSASVWAILRSGGACVCWLSEGSVKIMGLLEFVYLQLQSHGMFFLSSWVQWLNSVDFQECSWKHEEFCWRTQTIDNWLQSKSQCAEAFLMYTIKNPHSWYIVDAGTSSFQVPSLVGSGSWFPRVMIVASMASLRKTYDWNENRPPFETEHDRTHVSSWKINTEPSNHQGNSSFTFCVFGFHFAWV